MTGSFKRQRSHDGGDSGARGGSTIQHRMPSGQLRPNVRVPAYLEKTKSEIAATFQDLEWKQRFRLFHALENPTTSPYRVDRSDVVVDRNRYNNVQPWDEYRVKLNHPIGGSDYVNASPIVLRSRGSKGQSSSKPGNSKQAEIVFKETRYVATQGPKQGQYSHFWHMVHQETLGDENAIIMLTQCYESSKEKCAQYYPTSMDAPVLQLHVSDDEPETEDTPTAQSADTTAASPDPITSDTVTLLSVQYDTSTACDVRVFDVQINNVSKKIHHYLFKGWPDYGKPEAEGRTALLHLTRKTQAIARNSPRIVHCSAGVGRTGSFIALDFLIREIEEGRFIDNSLYPQLKSPTNPGHSDYNNFQTLNTPTVETWGKSGPQKVQTPTTEDGFNLEVDNQSYRDDLIYNTVNTLRSQRMMMVMNELQFAFLYEAIRDVFWDKYKVRPEGATVKAASPSISGPSDVSDGPPKAKTLVVEGDDSASEAETEIMEEAKRNDADISDGGSHDPYSAVAPAQVQEGLRKSVGSDS